MLQKVCVKTDKSRDDLLTDFGKTILTDRYCYDGESFQELFSRVATAYGSNIAHQQRLYDYMSKLWFMPATPILSNGGIKRGLPVSCFLNEASDSLEGILGLWSENVWLAAKGGGIGSYWGNVRSIGEEVRKSGNTSGILPFLKVMDSMTLAISQGSLRRGSAAIYLPVDHPEIEEFIEVRRPTGGDPSRKCLNLNHGVVISDSFMNAVHKGDDFPLISPKDQSVIRKTPARDLWARILTARLETGEPYILYIDNVNKARPAHLKALGLNVKTSNLCSEITLPTGRDHIGRDRTAICCLSSVNLQKWNSWNKNKEFIPDIMRFLDNVLTDFINRAPDSLRKATYSAMRERSVGLGVMGFHTFLQESRVPFGSALAKSWTTKIFKHIKTQTDISSKNLAEELGSCPDAADAGVNERFSHKTAIAPTASISIICGGVSPGIEPLVSNRFTHKTLSGSFSVRNNALSSLLKEKGMDTTETWATITQSNGSVQSLDGLSDDEKAIFRTAYEIDQRWVIDLAATRTPFIDQSSSVNLFLPADVPKKVLHDLHFKAWETGVKSLYYLRSMSLQRPGAQLKDLAAVNNKAQPPSDEECLSCQ